MKPYVLLTTGSRELPHHLLHTIGARIGSLALDLGDRPLIVRHGACPGPNSADQAVTDWTRTNGTWLGVTEDPHPADWDHCTHACPQGHRRAKKPGDIWHPGACDDYCPAAGPRRNAEMTALGADECWGFPHPSRPSFGTRNCMRLAEKAGITVRRFPA